jgi:hypothetical protein
MLRPIIILLIFSAVFIQLSAQNRSQDEMVYDGLDNVKAMGIDSTGHYWFITQTNSGYTTLHIDKWSSKPYESIRHLRFSPDGSSWAFFARDNVSWYIVTNDTSITLFCDDVVLLGFSPSSQVLYYAFKLGAEIEYHIGNKVIRGSNSTGEIFVSQNAERYAIGGWRGDRKVFSLQGWETTPSEDIRPLGFWNDGSFMYISKSGSGYEIYKDKEPISESYLEIKEYKMNLEGTSAAFLARRTQNVSVGVIISDQYYDPLVSSPFESVRNLALHPTLPLMAFVATENNTEFVVLSNTRFSGGQETGAPVFTHDGSQLYFPGCATDCFINIDGRRFNLYQMFSMMTDFVLKPKSNTIAYATNSSLVVRYLETKELVAGMMVDRIISPIFDWRRNAYISLGTINNRIYLLTVRV